MTLKFILACLIALAATGCYKEDKNSLQLPSKPDWHTSENDCSWRWIEGSGLGMWSEFCQLSTGQWSIVWDESQYGFVLQHENKMIDLVVQPWKISPDVGISSLNESLNNAGFLLSDNDCQWQRIPIQTSTSTLSFFELYASKAEAPVTTAEVEVPEPLCGPYGKSTHGVRYFMVDLRWPDLAIYVNEGQERPMFDPASITVLH